MQESSLLLVYLLATEHPFLAVRQSFIHSLTHTLTSKLSMRHSHCCQPGAGGEEGYKGTKPLGLPSGFQPTPIQVCHMFLGHLRG